MKRAIPARYGVGAALLVVGAVATHAWFNQTHGLDSLREYRSAPEPIAPPPGDARLYGVIEPLGSPPTPGGNAQMEQHERTVFSQHGEDGVIERIFELIPPTTTYAVEFGGGDGVTLSNVRNLIVNQGWSALMIDGDPGLVERCAEIYADVPAAKCRYAWVYPGNVELLFEEQGVPKDLDLLVIDIDSNDWYVWRAIHDFRPKVVQVEYNGLVAPPQRMVVDFHPMNYLDGPYFGASIQSFYELGKKKGYELVYANRFGVNLWFVQEEYFARFQIADNSPAALYRPFKGRYSLTTDQLGSIMKPDGTPAEGFATELTWKDLRITKRFRLDR